MNAGTAWSLMGLTLRLAMSLGLHRSCPLSTESELKAVRSKVWYEHLRDPSSFSNTNNKKVVNRLARQSALYYV